MPKELSKEDAALYLKLQILDTMRIVKKHAESQARDAAKTLQALERIEQRMEEGK